MPDDQPPQTDPPKKKPVNASPMVSFRISAGYFEELQRRAAAERRGSPSQMAKALVEKALELRLDVTSELEG